MSLEMTTIESSRRANLSRASEEALKLLVVLTTAVIVAFVSTPPSGAAGQGGVAATRHNLSASGPGEIRALNETEICKFCHIPHNAVAPAPLWAHTLSKVQGYQTPRLRTADDTTEPVPQPDGSSRLCLSCHDGTVALGDIGGRTRPIPMSGTRFLGPGRKGFIGTDLSGSHPVSFVVPDGDTDGVDPERDMGHKPLSIIRTDPAVRLDAGGKMQCTSCHDPHSDRYFQAGVVPRFWVKPTLEEVCLTCHELR
jgi:hypothetical protein